MKSVNRVELKGVLGQDAKVNNAGNRRVANLSVATEFYWIDKDNNQQKDTDWHNVVAWEVFGIADFSKLVKGAKVHIIGRLRTRTYTDKQGNQRYITEVVADELDVIDEQPKRPAQHTGGTLFKQNSPKNDEDF